MSDKIREAFDAWVASIDKRRDANGWEPLTARDVNMLREGYMEAALTQQPAPAAVPGGITLDQIERHSQSAGGCPSSARVVLLSSIKRMLAAAPAAPVAAGQDPVAWGLPDATPDAPRPFLVLFHSTSQANDPEGLVPLYAAQHPAEQPDTVKVSRELLEELAGDLTAELEARYSDKDHPALKHKYERDMRPVLEARALLAGGDKP